MLGGVFGFGLLALLGFPPFSLFVSEFSMARAEVDVGLWWVVAISFVCLWVIFGAFAMHGRQMLLGESPLGGANPSPPHARSPSRSSGALVLCAVIGVSAWPLQSLLHDAAHVVVTMTCGARTVDVIGAEELHDLAAALLDERHRLADCRRAR